MVEDGALSTEAPPMGDQKLPHPDDSSLPESPLSVGPIEELDSAVQERPFKVIEDFDSSVEVKPRYQEIVAQMVARKLLDVFAVTTIGILLAGVVLILMIMQHYGSPQDAETLVDKAIVPFLRGAASFATTVFGPLLAFILGFYFGKGSDS
jgi:hypothetical protein